MHMPETGILKLCLITDMKPQQALPDYLQLVESALLGGVTMVQLRDKQQDKTQLKETAIALKQLLKKYQRPFILNDHVDLARELDVDGVHLGQDDMSVNQARAILGKGKIIGLSIEHLEQLQQSNAADLTYVTASAVYPTNTKTNCKTIWGLEGLHTLVQQSRHPVTAIGGINVKNARAVIEAGAQGIAVISAIHEAINPRQAALALNEEMNHAR